MLMHHYGTPAKFATLILQMYENSTAKLYIMETSQSKY